MFPSCSLALVFAAAGASTCDLPSSIVEELSSIRCAGDVNRDGTADILLASRDEAGLGEVRVLSGADGSVLLDLRGKKAGDAFGYTMTSVGDLDGDGFPEIAVGARGGAVWELEGGIERSWVRHGDDEAYVRVFSGKDGRVLHTFVGVFTAAGAGDFDGDGSVDLLLGGGDSYRQSASWVEVHSVAKRATLLRLEPPVDPSSKSDRESAGSTFGASFGILGDVDGDRVTDLVVTYPNPFTGHRSGSCALLFSGRTGQCVASAQGFDFFLEGMGTSLVSTQDLDGDGRPDLLVSSPKQFVRALSGKDLHTQFTILSPTSPDPTWGFGSSVDTIGDVDGDQHPDLVIAADEDPGLCDAGLAWVYSGRDGSLIRKLFFSEDEGVEVCTLRDSKGNPSAEVALRIRTRKPPRTLSSEKTPADRDVLRIVSARDGKTVREFDLTKLGAAKPPAPSSK